METTVDLRTTDELRRTLERVGGSNGMRLACRALNRAGREARTKITRTIGSMVPSVAKKTIRDRVVWMPAITVPRGVFRFTGAGDRKGRGLLRPRDLRMQVPRFNHASRVRPATQQRGVVWGDGVVPQRATLRSFAITVGAGRTFSQYGSTGYDKTTAVLFQRGGTSSYPFSIVYGPSIGTIAKDNAVVNDATAMIGSRASEELARLVALDLRTNARRPRAA